MIGLAAGAAVAGLAAAVVVLAEVEAVDGGRRQAKGSSHHTCKKNRGAKL